MFYFNGPRDEDIVEDDGIVILRFGEGSMDNWDVDTKTYFDENPGTVKVYGGADVILEFGCFEPVPGDGLGLADKNRIWE